MEKENIYDIDRLAEIILCLINNFGKDSLIIFLLDRLIRKWSNTLIPTKKSKKFVELEKKFCVSSKELSRSKIYNKNKEMSKLIIIEHGLPERQAIEMCFENPKKEKIKYILNEIEKNLVYITKMEHDKFDKNIRQKGKNGYYWENMFGKNGIEIDDILIMNI